MDGEDSGPSMVEVESTPPVPEVSVLWLYFFTATQIAQLAQCYLHGPGNFGILGSNKNIQPIVILLMMDCSGGLERLYLSVGSFC